MPGVCNRKAGLSGLFCSGLLAFALTAATTISSDAAPLVLKVENVSVAADEHTRGTTIDSPAIGRDGVARAPGLLS